MANFDTLLSSLHGDKGGGAIQAGDSANLVVSANRQFSTASNFDTIIGYEGDINSQIIVIQLPETHAGHQLSLCDHKELKWKNLSNGAEGTSDLADGKNSTLYEWEVPSDLMAAAGTIEIYISFYDKSGEHLAFAWNTAPYSGLSVGKTMASVGSYLPARDEILLIDEETHNIIAPVGYNNIVGNFGEVGVSNIYFLVNRYLGKNKNINVVSAEVTLYVVIPNIMAAKATITNKELYSAEIDGHSEGLVLLTWEMPKQITSNANAYIGKFDIAIGFTQGENTYLSNTYSNLTIGDSLLRATVPVTPDDPMGDFKEGVFKAIDEYFTINSVSFFGELEE